MKKCIHLIILELFLASGSLAYGMLPPNSPRICHHVLIHRRPTDADELLKNALRFGNCKEINNLVTSDNINDFDAITRATPLMYASQLGRFAVVNLLLSKGASIDLQDADKYTALMCAARFSQILSNDFSANSPKLSYKNVVWTLLAYGANVLLRDKFGRTALMIAQEEKDPGASINQEHTHVIEMLKAAEERARVQIWV